MGGNRQNESPWKINAQQYMVLGNPSYSYHTTSTRIARQLAIISEKAGFLLTFFLF